MNDCLVKSLSYNRHVRIYVITTTDTVNAIGSRLNYYPSALAAMGRVVSVGTMMGGMLKKDETITIKVDGNGPIGLIMVDANARGEVRAYVSNPHVHFEYSDKPKLNVRATVGDQGIIHVIKDLKLKEPFIGTVPIISGEIAEDFAYYFSVSEQTPAVVSLGTLVGEDNLALNSGGFIIQLLPNTPEEVIDELEKKIKDLPTMTQLLSEGKTPVDIVKILGDDTTEILDIIPVSFKCKCSRERFERGILSLGYEEIMDMVKTDGEANATCNFCGNQYHFSKEQLEFLAQCAKKSTIN